MQFLQKALPMMIIASEKKSEIASKKEMFAL